MIQTVETMATSTVRRELARERLPTLRYVHSVLLMFQIHIPQCCVFDL